MGAFDNLKNNLKLIINSDNNSENETELKTEYYKPASIPYEDWGFKKAKNLNGSNSGLLACLALIREDHKQMVQRDTNRQNRLKEPLIAELKSNEEQKSDKENKVHVIENDIIKSKKDQINILKNEIEEIKRNPTSVMPDKLSKVGFYIGLLILLALTVYLFIFYSSASYSAFFKEFTLNDLGVASSVFDPQAITKALKDGITELILILSMPFVFIGLGFLIHQFQKSEGIKKYFQIIILIVVTFVFDAILAYEITEKIYNIKKEGSFESLPNYDIAMAFNSVNFWLIIFAGFVVYIIWGFVFDFTIESYDKLDVIKQEINSRNRKIVDITDEIKIKQKDVGSIHDEIEVLKKNIQKLKGRINGVIIDTTEFNKILFEFKVGWLHWMNANQYPQSKIDEAKQKADEFIQVNVREVISNEIK